MPFDANLVLADTTLDWNYANLVTSDYGTPVLTTRNDAVFAFINLLALSTTSAKGMACVLVIDEAGNSDADALTVLLQASDEYTFSTAGGDIVRTLANFEVAGLTHGVILGSECPCTVIRRFTTTLRYIRVDASCTSSDDFHTCQVLLAPWPFHTL